MEGAALKRQLVEVFSKYYPATTADALAVMHAQLHMQFAAEMHGVPLDGKDPRHSIKRQAKLARVIDGVRGTGMAGGSRMQRNARARLELYDELKDLMESNGSNELSFAQISQYFSHLEPSRDEVREPLLKLEREKFIVRIGKTNHARYRLAETPK